MKTTTLILSLYVLLLAVMPCPCEQAYMLCRDAAAVETVDCGCGHEPQDTDLCTPFCVVSQCMHTPVALMDHSVRVLPVVVFLSERHAYVIQAKPLAHGGGTVWRPPIAVV